MEIFETRGGPNLSSTLAFTLAEILITLGIIGIVAALTMPSIIAKYQDKVLITATKKAYSTIQNALLEAQADGGTIGDNTYLFDVTQNNVDLAKRFQKYFNGAILCENKTSKGCKEYYDITYLYATKQVLNGSTSGQALNYPKLILPDGMILSLSQQASCLNVWYSCERDDKGNCKKDEHGNDIMKPGSDDACAYIYFDVNGVKGPNQFGRDGYCLKIREKDMTGIFYNPLGAKSLKNILSGTEKLIYEKYTIGETVE